MIPCRVDYIGVRGHARLWRNFDVRVPENAMRCVGFVSEVVASDASGEDLDHFATGFFVSMRSPSLPGMMFLYFVTAKHVATEFEGREFRLIVNKKGGGIKQVRGIGDIFWGHPYDDAADVAVMPIYGEANMDIVYTSAEEFLEKDNLHRGGIGVGDEVYVVGLFTPASASDKVAPIVRHGNLAMLPEEKVQTELGFADVYLIEARSIGGLSGSPVFARPSVLLSAEKDESGNVKPVFGVGGQKFLGVIQGHWDIREFEKNSPRIAHTMRGVNIGIAVVTPAYKVLETLNRAELVDLRARIEENHKRSITPTSD